MVRYDEFDRQVDAVMRSFFGMVPRRRQGLLLAPQKCQVTPRNLGYRDPVADFWQDDKEVVVTAELPGLEKTDIHVDVTDDGVQIKAEKKETSEDGTKKLSRAFYKYFRLPPNADSVKARAEYKNGILEITIPKTEDTSKRRLEIE